MKTIAKRAFTLLVILATLISSASSVPADDVDTMNSFIDIESSVEMIGDDYESDTNNMTDEVDQNDAISIEEVAEDPEAETFSDSPPTDESSISMPEDNRMTDESFTDDPQDNKSEDLVEFEDVTESTIEEIVGNGFPQQYLTILWQDNYTQKMVLGKDLSGNACLAESKKILQTMGLPADTYKLTLTDSANVSARIISRNYYPGDDEVRVLAHMGYYKTATRNTLSSYRVARALGFHYVGGDIRFTKDNVAVVVHDPTINATARNADGSIIKNQIVIRQHTYKELLKYDFGLSTNSVWKGEKIPTLEEYLKTCKAIGLNPNIHIKTDSNLTKANFESVAYAVLNCGMQGRVTYAANIPSYLTPIIKIDPISLIDIVVTDKWDSHYVTDALALKTGTNQVELAISKRLYHHNIATTCRYNGILITALANTASAAAALDAYVDEISTDGTLPDEIIKGARKRQLHGLPIITSDPKGNTDYQIRTHANYGLMIRMLSSMPYTPIRINTNEAATEVCRWRFERLSNGYYQILSSRNMFVIGVKNGATYNGAQVYQTKRNTSYKAQMWKLVHNKDGSVSFINVHSGKAIQVAKNNENPGSYFLQNTYDGRSSQCFWLTESPVQTNTKFGNVYRLQSPNKTISVSTVNGSTAYAANVLTAGNSDNDIQKYKIIYSGDGYYRIENIKTGYCLTLTGTGKTGNIISQPWYNTDRQRWKLVWNGNGSGMYLGTYRIMSKLGASCITIDGGISPGKNIKADWWTGKTQQQWRVSAA